MADIDKIATALIVLFDQMTHEEIGRAVNLATGTTMCLTKDAYTHLREANAHILGVQQTVTETMKEFGEPPLGRLKCDALKNSLARADGRCQSASHHIDKVILPPNLQR